MRSNASSTTTTAIMIDDNHSTTKPKTEECLEFNALALPNILGGALVLWGIHDFIAHSDVRVVVPTLLVVCAAVYFVINNVGEPKQGKYYEIRMKEKKEKENKVECLEFNALAVPNVLGGGLLLWKLHEFIAHESWERSALLLLSGLGIFLFCYYNVGEAQGGKVFREKNKKVYISPCTCTFIGLGTMGFEMAAHLAQEKNIKLRVWNRTHRVSEQHEKEFNSVSFEKLKDAVVGSDIIITCLPTSDIVHQVAKEVIDILEKAGKVSPTCWVDCTSGVPKQSQEIASLLETKNIKFLDAPVSGGPKGASNASLTFMVGGEEDTFSKIYPILNVMGKKIKLVGPVGSGHAVKSINNALNATALLMSAEGLLALKEYGVDPKTALDVINASSGRNLSTQEKIPQEVLNRKFSFGFASNLMKKDVSIASSLLSEPLHDGFIDKSLHILEETCEKFGNDSDFTSCVRILEDRVNIQLD